MLSAQGSDMEVEMLVQLFEFVFDEDLLERFQECALNCSAFFKELCQDIISAGEKYWLVLRSLLN